MKAEYYEDIEKGEKTLCITVGRIDLQMIKFDTWDRYLMEECNKSDLLSDKLLMTEMIVRKIEKSGVNNG